MSIVFMDSFDLYGAYTELADRGWTITSTPTIETTVVKDGRASLKLDSGEAVTRTLASAISGTWYVGLWCRFAAFATASSAFLTMTGDFENLILHATITGQLYLGNAGGTPIRYSQTILAVDTWYFIEVKGTFANSISANDVIVYVDGAEVINLPAGTDTLWSGSTSLKAVKLSGTTAGARYFDSFVIWDTTGSGDWTGYMNPFRMEVIQPNGNGNSNQFTGSDGNSTDNYLLVDEDTKDDDTTYVESTATSQTDLYTFENCSGSVSTISAVNTVAIWKKTTADAKNARQVVRISSTNYETSDIAPTTSYTWNQRTMQTSPATSSAWTKSEVDGAEFGVKDQS